MTKMKSIVYSEINKHILELKSKFGSTKLAEMDVRIQKIENKNILQLVKRGRGPDLIKYFFVLIREF